MLRSGSICVSFLYNYLLSETKIDEKEGCTTLVNRHNKLSCLADTFSSYGGVLAKISQILCLGDGNDKNHVFSDCKPYCQKETIEYLKKEFIENKVLFKNVKEIDFNVFKSGSIGQVHKSIYYYNGENKEIIIKVQYLGLYEQFKNDIFILDTISSYLFYFSDLSSAMKDIKTKLYEELDYNIEFNNQENMFKLWYKHDNIKIAKLIPELCTKNILSMDFIDAENLTTFIETSTQEEKNNIGKYIVEFIFTNLYKNKIFYTDIHYGNFLVKDKIDLYITDFGCLNYLDDKFINNMISLHRAIYNEDEESFFGIVKDIGILKDDISEKSKEYMYNYFKLQYEPWISDGFEFTDEWIAKSIYKEVDLMKEWVLPTNCVHLNKIPYGLYHILTKLKLKENFLDLFKELINI